MFEGSVTENVVLTPDNPRARSMNRNRLAIVTIFLIVVSFLSALVILNYGIPSFLFLLAIVVALPLIYVLLAFPKAGIVVLLTFAYIIMFFVRFTEGAPLGTVMDAIELLLVAGFFLKQKSVGDWSAFTTPVGIMLLVWIVYNIFEVVNPAAESTLAWVYATRPIVLVALTYFLFHFHIRDVGFIRLILKIWLCLSIIAALYALKQEYFGFADFEMRDIKADPLATRLYFIGNHWRRFSIFSDPVSLAYNMVISSVMCICLMSGPFAAWKKLVLGAMCCLFITAMLYSGTRGAYVLFPVAFVLYSVLRYNKRVMLIGMVVFLVTAVLVVMPTSNYTLYRFQTAFKPGKDASYLVRKANQKKIQPYILSHPLGGGVGSTGVWGRRFSPYSYLASFPPDSGYVRVAVEQGWVGLFIFCTLMFVILKTGIQAYFRMSDPELKSYCLAMLIVVFALNVGNYPQEALVQYPINIYFYLAVALLGVTSRLDKNKERFSEIKSGGKTKQGNIYVR
jgi:putative inorganic carbon (hco3(-)) transporter